jgi:type IX secretion system PorP/SprF family membrane protein
MKKVRLPCFIFVFLVCFTNSSRSQDIHFSQFYESPLLLNPAAAGASAANFRFVVNYKNQWKSVINPYKTAAIAFDSHVYTDKRHQGSSIGYGFTLYNDKAGLSKVTTNQGSLDLAYHLQASRSSNLSAGVKLGFFQRTINTTDLKWDAQYDGKTYDAALPTGESAVFSSFMKFDLAAGLLYNYYNRSNGMRLELGGSMSHITKPKISFYSSDPSLNFKYIAHMRLQMKMSEGVYFVPGGFYALQGKHQEITAGASIKIAVGEETREHAILNTFSLMSSAIQFGAYYRVKDAMIFTAALDYKHNMTFGVSYDLNTSKLNLASKRRGGLEFSFVLRGGARAKGSRNNI